MTRQQLVDGLEFVQEHTLWYPLEEPALSALGELFVLLEQADGPAFSSQKMHERIAEARSRTLEALGDVPLQSRYWHGALLAVSAEYLGLEHP